MKKIELKNHHTMEQLREELRKSKDGCYSLRILKKGEKKTIEIEEILLIGRDNISRWVRQYNEHGLEWLKSKKPKERNKKYNRELFKELFEKINESKENATIYDR